MITIKTAVITRFVARNHCFDDKKPEIADFFPKTIHSIEMGIIDSPLDCMKPGKEGWLGQCLERQAEVWKPTTVFRMRPHHLPKKGRKRWGKGAHIKNKQTFVRSAYRSNRLGKPAYGSIQSFIFPKCLRALSATHPTMAVTNNPSSAHWWKPSPEKLYW